MSYALAYLAAGIVCTGALAVYWSSRGVKNELESFVAVSLQVVFWPVAIGIVIAAVVAEERRP